MLIGVRCTIPGRFDVRFVPWLDGGQGRGFLLQECNRSGGSLPAQVNCLYDHFVELHSYVKLTGRFATHGRVSLSDRIIFKTETIGYISRDDAFEERPDDSTWFVERNIKSLQLPAQDLFVLLNSQAMKEGFRLVHKKSLKENYVTFRCYQHSFYGKNE